MAEPQNHMEGMQRIVGILAMAKPFAPLPEAPTPPKSKRKSRKPSTKKRRKAATSGQSENPREIEGEGEGTRSSSEAVAQTDARSSSEAIAQTDEQESAPIGEDPPPAEDTLTKLPSATINLCAGEPLNDTGNGKRLLYWFGSEILHVRAIGWHWWTGTHWSKEGGEEVVTRYAQITAARIKLERSALPLTIPEQAAVEAGEAAATALVELGKKIMESSEEDHKDEARRLRGIVERADEAKRALGSRKGARAKFSVSSGNTAKINGMILQALVHKIVDVSELDVDPHAFNTESHTLRFVQVRDLECPDPDTVRLKWIMRADKHNPDDFITKCAPVKYHEDAKAPEWFKFLERVQPDHVMRDFLRDFHGYGMTGDTGMQAFMYNTGGGANGKSTFIECIMRMVGAYGDLLNPESFTGSNQRRGDQANPDLADLPGVRLLRVSELPKGAKLQEHLIKALTGGEPMKVRHNYDKRFFTFIPAFKASMSGNEIPDVHDNSDGMWRRMMIVPWDVQIPVGERREFEAMQKAFKAEWPGILNWLIEGCLSYLEVGRLERPDRVAEATAAHRSEMDPIGKFLDACVERAEGQKVAGGALYRTYLGWCNESGLKPFFQTAFGKAVPKHGWVKSKSGTVRYHDMQITPDALLRFSGGETPPDPHKEKQ